MVTRISGYFCINLNALDTIDVMIDGIEFWENDDFCGFSIDLGHAVPIQYIFFTI